jgi:ubiquitin C-terminal hydrolase
LIIYISRFGNCAEQTWKDPRPVTFPLEGLDLSPFVHVDPSAGSDDDPNRTLYDLFAVVFHNGHLNKGHYYTAARKWMENSLSPDWHMFDDHNVNPVETAAIEAQALVDSTYLLCYRRRGSPWNI